MIRRGSKFICAGNNSAVAVVGLNDVTMLKRYILGREIHFEVHFCFESFIPKTKWRIIIKKIFK